MGSSAKYSKSKWWPRERTHKPWPFQSLLVISTWGIHPGHELKKLDKFWLSKKRTKIHNQFDCYSFLLFQIDWMDLYTAGWIYTPIITPLTTNKNYSTHHRTELRQPFPFLRFRTAVDWRVRCRHRACDVPPNHPSSNLRLATVGCLEQKNISQMVVVKHGDLLR